MIKQQTMLRSFIAMLFAFFLVISANAADLNTWISTTQKFPVVFAVLLIIFVGLFFFLVRLEKRISKLEKSDK